MADCDYCGDPIEIEGEYIVARYRDGFYEDSSTHGRVHQDCWDEAMDGGEDDA